MDANNRTALLRKLHDNYKNRISGDYNPDDELELLNSIPELLDEIANLQSEVKRLEQEIERMM